MELETSKAKNTAPCQEMRQPGGRVLRGTEASPGTGMFHPCTTAQHPCLFPGSLSRTVAALLLSVESFPGQDRERNQGENAVHVCCRCLLEEKHRLAYDRQLAETSQTHTMSTSSQSAACSWEQCERSLCLQGALAASWLMIQHPHGHARLCCAGLVGFTCQTAGQCSHHHFDPGTMAFLCLVPQC